MKIALVTSTFLPARNSGAIQLRDLAQELARQGHSITIFVPSSEIDAAWKVEEIGRVRIIRLRALAMSNVGHLRRAIAEQLMPYAMRFAYASSPFSGERWDGVVWYSPAIFHAPFVRHLKRKGGGRGYLIIRDIFPEWAVDVGLLHRGFVYRYFKKIARSQYEIADVIGVQTEGNLKYFLDWQRKSPGRKLEVLNNWLGPVPLCTNSFRLADTSLAGRKVFVYTGNMGLAQGVDVLVELAKRLYHRKDIGFLFVGRGSEVARLKDRAAALQLESVLFHDEVEHEQLPEIYRQCHVGLIALDPRHKSHNIPGKLLGYLQNGLPILASVNEGNDLIKIIEGNKIGHAISGGDLESLVKASEDIVDRVLVDDVLEGRCVDVFENLFSVEAVCQQILAALFPFNKKDKNCLIIS